MCGIAGYLNFDGAPAEEARLRRMAQEIAHRGPDGEGVTVSGACGLAHRRLAIIDLSDASLQPFHSRCGRYSLVYNGEVYNFKELRQELEMAGHAFRTEGDTEVVLTAIKAWGPDAAALRFNGMFAFALWDTKHRQLTMVRDRYGIKPVYYCKTGTRFVFGSEIKAIFASGLIESKLGLEGLVEYLTFQNFFSTRTLFNNVHLLEAGTILTVSADGRTRQKRYWDYSFQEPDERRSKSEYLEELDFIFRRAVTRQLVSDVDVGSYLSGGMDSGSITAIAAQELPFMRSFTVGFDLHSASGVELGFDERSSAEFMSYKFKTEHYEMVLKAGDMERIMPRLSWHLEEPRVGQSYPNFYAAQLASKFVKVVLSGAGGDEFFAGYPWRYYRAVVNTDSDAYIDKYLDFWQRLLDHNQLKSVLAPVWDDVKHITPRDIFSDVFSGLDISQASRPEDYVNLSLHFEAKTFLHGLLVVEDKLSMASSLETRVPFLDNDLVDFAMKLPVGLKLGNLNDVVRQDENQMGKSQQHFAKTRDGKLILRELMSRYIPSEISNAVKQGFSAPDASWFKGESIEYVKRIVNNSDSQIYNVFDEASVRKLVDEHMKGVSNRRLLIWSLLSLESGIQQYLSNDAETAVLE